MLFPPGTIVRPTDEMCRLCPSGYFQNQRYTVVSADEVTPTNRHPITGEFIGPSLGNEYLIRVRERVDPISSILVQRVQ